LLTFHDIVILMKRTPAAKRSVRRKPTQLRAQQTVDAILQAVLRIAKREGLGGLTTNRIAEVAGVSIGSVYQYFPDKRAIFVALHERHIEEIDRILGAALVAHAASPLEKLIRALVDAMVDAHTADPELGELLSAEVPHRAGGSQDFAVRLDGAFRLAIGARMHGLKGRDLDKAVFVVTHMVESLCHGAVLRRPVGISLAEGKEETVRAVMAYLKQGLGTRG
jgi:AcrR family transcriptional regulator